jgi:hypothetical protein
MTGKSLKTVLLLRMILSK